MKAPEISFGFSAVRDVRYVADHAKTLEDLGYDFMGIAEHLMLGNPPAETCLSIPILAVAAGATRRIRLLSSVVLLPLYHPTLLAKLVADIDTASNGRYILGIGVGGESSHEFRAVDVPVNQRGRRSDEALTLMKRLWTEEQVTFEGRYYQADDITLNPPPLQKPHPPIWVGGRRDAAMQRAARFGDGWFPYLYNPERYRRSVGMIQDFAAKEGRDLTGFAWGHHQHVVLGDSEKEAFQVASEAMPYSSERSADKIIQDYYLYGTPDDIIKGIEKLVEAGVREISFITLALDSADTIEYARILAQKVIPYFRS